MDYNAPPHNRDAEHSLIGCLFLDPSLIGRVTEVVGTHESFYTLEARNAFRAMQTISAKGGEIDWVSVGEEMIRDDPHYEETLQKDLFAELQFWTESTPTSAGTLQYAEYVAELAKKRAIIASCRDVISACKDPTVNISEVEAELMQLVDTSDPSTFSVPSRAASANDVKQTITSLSLGGYSELAWTTGNPKIDQRSIGYIPGAIDAVCAHTGEGKTFYAWKQAEAFILNNGLKAGIVSGEMSAAELVQRQIVGDDVLAAIAGGSTALVGDAIKRVEAYKEGGPLIAQMRDMKLGSVMNAVRLLGQRGCKLVFVDYLQLIRSSESDPNERAFVICDALKTAAQRMGMQIVVLSQFNKEGRRENPMFISEDDLYGGSALSFACHRISVLVRLTHHERNFENFERGCEGLRKLDMKPEQYVLERVIKSRRGEGKPYMAGFRYEKPHWLPATSGELETMRNLFAGERRQRY